MDKYIFFDIDGVLNNNKTVYDGKSPVILDDKNLKNLRKVVDSTNAKLVMISSHKDSWVKGGIGQGEKGDYIDSKFADYGLTVYDKTGGGLFYKRGRGIKAYIKANKADGFVILDDSLCDYVEEELKDFWVRPDGANGGLTKTLVKEAITILNKGV